MIVRGCLFGVLSGRSDLSGPDRPFGKPIFTSDCIDDPKRRTVPKRLFFTVQQKEVCPARCPSSFSLHLAFFSPADSNALSLHQRRLRYPPLPPPTSPSAASDVAFCRLRRRPLPPPTSPTIAISEQQLNKHAAKLKTAPLLFPDLCTELFEMTTSTGFQSWGPSSTQPEPVNEVTIDDSDDVECIPVETPPPTQNRGASEESSVGFRSRSVYGYYA